MLQSTHKTQFLQFFLIFSFAFISLSDPAIVTYNCVRLIRSPCYFELIVLSSTP